MPIRNLNRAAATVLAATTLTMTALAGTPASADPEPPPAPSAAFDLPAGLACQFPIRIVQTPAPALPREFEDHNGNVVRLMATGKGVEVAVTNQDNGRSFTTEANGSNTVATIDPVTGMQSVRSTGHNILILFPTDVPAGPSTTLYIGLVEYTVDPTGVFTLGHTAGQAIDICALLA